MSASAGSDGACGFDIKTRSMSGNGGRPGGSIRSCGIRLRAKMPSPSPARTAASTPFTPVTMQVIRDTADPGERAYDPSMTTASRLKAAVVVMPLVAVAGAITGGPRAAWLPALVSLTLAGRLVSDHYAPSRLFRHTITAASILLLAAAVALSLDETYHLDPSIWTGYVTWAIVILCLPAIPYRTVWNQFLGRPTPPVR